MKTLAQELAEENEALRRRFIHHTRPKRPLTLDEARALQMAVIDSSELVETLNQQNGNSK